MKLRWKIALVLLLLVVMTCYVTLFAPFGLSIHEATRITKGMPSGQVMRILGSPDEIIPDRIGDTTNQWYVADGIISICVVSNKVHMVLVLEYPRWQRVYHDARKTVGIPADFILDPLIVAE
jgi:hypothetical protein